MTVSTGGAITGFTFVPGPAATVTSPTSVPLHLLALERAAQAAESGQVPNARAVGGDGAGGVTADALLRAAVVNVAKYYLGLAQSRTPAQMEALIWDNTSLDGADHGPSCAAFASLALELAAQAVGQRSWVTGGTTYPWPMPAWADVRVDENPASPGITSMVQDAEAHGRWHPLGDGYAPQPGDWVLFDEHVEVVTSYSDDVLETIGANSEPHMTVNAHSYTGSLAADGVQGFIDNGHLEALGTTVTGAAAQGPTAKDSGHGSGSAAHGSSASHPATTTRPHPAGTSGASTTAGLAHIPGVVQPSGPGVTGDPTPAATGSPGPTASHAPGTGSAAATGSAGKPAGTHASATATGAPRSAKPTGKPTAAAGSGQSLAIIPGIAQPEAAGADALAPVKASARTATASPGSASPTTASPTTASPTMGPYRKYSAPASTTPGTSAQQAFINLVAPGAIAGEQRYGVPAAVTIAQAIDESGWGQSELATQYHNLFGIKGSGPAGSVTLPTSEYEGGEWVWVDAQFRVYENVAQSITDHDELLATSGYYVRAMADRAFPDAFANDLSGVYASDPDYGANLIALMKLYDLYRFDAPASSQAAAAPKSSATAQPSATDQPSSTAHQAAHSSSKTAHPGMATIPGLTAPALAPGSNVPTVEVNALGVSALGAPAAALQTVADSFATASTARFSSPTMPTITVPTSAVPTSAMLHAAGAQTAVPIATMSSVSRPISTRAGLAAGGVTTAWYQPELPGAVRTAYFATAKGALGHAEILYRDVAARAGIPWQVLAACDWMQCKAHPRYSPVQGEKLGAVNRDGTSFRTKSQALAQCAADLVTAAAAIYMVDLMTAAPLSVRSLAEVFAAFRWGSLLRRHGVSAMEFPYSMAGLTSRHTKMHWPDIDAPDAPDRPGGRFREPFGAVPVVLSLGYPATV